MISVYHYMSVAAILFAMGTYGVLTRRNAIVIFMCVELNKNQIPNFNDLRMVIID